MRRPARIQRSIFVSLALACTTTAWWGCNATPAATTSSTGQGGSGGSTSSSSGTGATGGIDFDGGGGGSFDDASCTSTGAEAHRVPLDIVILLDRSGSMTGAKWQGVTSALTTFFKDPESYGINVGLVYMPSIKASSCDVSSYVALDVPIAALPQNAFALTNSMPADAQGYGTPTYVALKGSLMTATAWQDLHPTHKVILVFATDGEPFACGGGTIDESVAVASAARNYNGVLTYVIGADGALISNLDKIAAAGGTTKSYDVTQDINLFYAKMAEIRKAAIGCDFELPPPPMGMQLNPDQVNFTYLPKGVGTPKLVPRADDLADCNGAPGWYYDSNALPTKIVLCPASCTTVQADTNAKVEVLFGCKSVPN